MFHYLFSSVQDVTIGGLWYPEHRAALSHRPGESDNEESKSQPGEMSPFRAQRRAGNYGERSRSRTIPDRRESDADPGKVAKHIKRHQTGKHGNNEGLKADLPRCPRQI